VEFETRMKICTIIGARPQFIKAAAVSRAIAAHNRLTLNIERRTLMNP
jgi:UDP-N-acetylglucosamine 2-epimerase